MMTLADVEAIVGETRKHTATSWERIISSQTSMQTVLAHKARMTDSVRKSRALLASLGENRKL